MKFEYVGWTWFQSIGLLYGEGPAGEQEQVAQPLMTSPWVVVCSEQERADYGDGNFVRIFASYEAAMEFVAQKAEVMV